MIRYLTGDRPAFVLETDNTSYAFSITPSGHPEHLYYGRRIELSGAEELPGRIRENSTYPVLMNVICSEKSVNLSLAILLYIPKSFRQKCRRICVWRYHLRVTEI